MATMAVSLAVCEIVSKNGMTLKTGLVLFKVIKMAPFDGHIYDFLLVMSV